MQLRPMIAALLAAGTVAAGGVLGAAPAQAAGTSCVPPPVAHRGDSARAPENTLPAFRKALALGVRRLELDVRFTSGDTPVLMHDPAVDRTTDGTGLVADLTLAQVRALDAGSWFGSRFVATRVPTLYQVLDLAARNRAYVMVELKPRPTAAQLAQVIDRVRRLGMTRRITLTSFDGPTLVQVRAAAPDIRTAKIDNPGYRQAESVLQFGRTYLVNAASVTEARAARWRRAGIALRPWTVDTARGWGRMANDRAEATITNRPADYLRWARARCR